MRQLFKCIFMLVLLVLTIDANAESFKAFNSNSRGQIEQNNQGKAFVLAFWSVDCPYCIDEMKVLGYALRKHPKIKLITVCTDATGREVEISKALDQAHLQAHERWQFAENDEDRLRYNVDKSWGGELPRTYFYDPKHQVDAISGSPQPAWLTHWFSKLNSH